MILRNSQISNWVVSMVIWIATKNLIICSFYHPDPSIEFQSVHSFLSNVANKQTDRQPKLLKHNLLV